MIQPAAVSEATIWERIIRPERPDLPVEAARFFLQLSFDPSDLDRMHHLAERHQHGELSSTEEEELRSYRHVGLQLDLLRSKARRALKSASPS